MNPYTEYNYNSDLLCDIRRMIAIYTSQIAYDSMADMFIRRKFTHNWTLRFGEVWWSVHDRSTDAPHGSAHIRQNGECNYEFHVWIRSWCGWSNVFGLLSLFHSMAPRLILWCFNTDDTWLAFEMWLFSANMGQTIKKKSQSGTYAPHHFTQHAVRHLSCLYPRDPHMQCEENCLATDH